LGNTFLKCRCRTRFLCSRRRYLGIEASLASRAARPYVRVVINWAHRLQDLRPGHLPPPGTREEIQAAVETAIQSERYTTDANGVMNGMTDIHGIEVGFRGKQVGEVIAFFEYDEQ